MSVIRRRTTRGSARRGPLRIDGHSATSIRTETKIHSVPRTRYSSPVQTATAALSAFLQARNEQQRELRDHLLEQCWAIDGRFEANERIAEGRAAVSGLIATELKDPKHYVRLEGEIHETGSDVWGRWQIARFEGAPIRERFQAKLSAGGLIEHVEVAPDSTPADTHGTLNKVLESVASNPAAAAGLLGGGIFLALRLPLGLFYGKLGVTPEEVGFGAQVLVPQSVVLLVSVIAIALGAMLIFNGVIHPLTVATTAAGRLQLRGDRRGARKARILFWSPIIIAAVLWYCSSFLIVDAGGGLTFIYLWPLGGFVLVSLAGVAGQELAFRRSPAGEEVRWIKTLRHRGEEARWGLRALATVLMLAAVYALVFISPFFALDGAGAIRNTQGSSLGRVFPWRALPATLRWKADAARVQLDNDCHLLRYLGTDGHTLVLYDNRLDKAFRIPSDDVSMSVALRCRGPAPFPPPVAPPTTVDAKGQLVLVLATLWDDLSGMAELKTKDRVAVPGKPGQAVALTVARQRFSGHKGDRPRLTMHAGAEAAAIVRAGHDVPVRLTLRGTDKNFNTTQGVFCLHLVPAGDKPPDTAVRPC